MPRVPRYTPLAQDTPRVVLTSLAGLDKLIFLMVHLHERIRFTPRARYREHETYVPCASDTHAYLLVSPYSTQSFRGIVYGTHRS